MLMGTTYKPELFDKVEEYIVNAELVAFDGCHKIYLAMDEIEAEWFRNNYNGVHCDDRTFEGTAEQMLMTVLDWWENSCFLRFISAVYHNEDDPNAGFVSLIGQFEDEDDEDENDYEDEDENY